MLRHTFADFARFPRQFWLLLAGSLLSSTGAAMVWPFLTIFLRERLDISLTTIALLLSLNSAAAIVVSFIGGPVADKFGRKGIMVFSLAAGAIYFLLMTQAASFWSYAVLITIWGGVNPLYAIGANAMIADLVQAEDRTDAYAILRTVHNVGVAAGPAIGGFIASVSYSATFYTAAICFGLFCLYTWIMIRESLPTGSNNAEARSVQTGFGPVLRDSRFMGFMLMFIITMMAASILWLLLPVYTKENFQLPESQYGLLVTVNALMCIFLQVFVTRLARRFSAMPVLAVGALFYAIGIGSVALGSTFAAFMASMIIMTLGELIMTPTATTLAANLSPLEMRGRYMSLFGLAWPAGSGIGPIAAGWLNDRFSPKAMWVGGLVFGLMSTIGFLGLSLSERKTNRNQAAQEIDLGL